MQEWTKRIEKRDHPATALSMPNHEIPGVRKSDHPATAESMPNHEFVGVDNNSGAGDGRGASDDRQTEATGHC